MARTNGDLDYDNWVLFFTGHGAAGGGSDLDQGDTRRDFLAQRHRRLRRRTTGGSAAALTLNVGLRYDIYGNFTERNGRIGNYYLPDAAAAARRAARLPGARERAVLSAEFHAARDWPGASLRARRST